MKHICYNWALSRFRDTALNQKSYPKNRPRSDTEMSKKISSRDRIPQVPRMQLAYKTHPSPLSEDPLTFSPPRGSSSIRKRSIQKRIFGIIPQCARTCAYVVFHLTVSFVAIVGLTMMSSQPHTPYFSQLQSTGYVVVELFGVHASLSARRVRLRW